MSQITNTAFKLRFLVLASLFVTTFASCKKDNGDMNSSNVPLPKEKNYNIIVVDESNRPVADAKISDGRNSVMSNSSGTAILKAPIESFGKYRFSIDKNGFFTGSLNLVTFANPDSSYKVMLLASASTATIPSTGGIINGSGFSFTSMGGYQLANGTPVTGNVNISIRYIKPNDFETLRNAFPGQDFTGLSGTNESWLYIYGWVAISYSQNGVKVFPTAGSVNIKVQVPGIYANATQNGGKVFYYDELARIWEESANPIVSGLDIIMPLPSKTTFCALGKLVPTTTIKYKKTTCMPGDFYGYAVQVEFDFERFENYVRGIPGFSMDLRRSLGFNTTLGADKYPSGKAIGNQAAIFLFRATGSTDGTYTNAIFDNLGFENEYFIFPTAYDAEFKVHSIRIPLKQGQEKDPLSDRVIKVYSSLPAGVTNLGILNTVCTGTTPNPHSSSPSTGNGQFTYNGQTINVTCTAIQAQTIGCSSSKDLVMFGIENFIIKNIPLASTGTFSVNGSGNDNDCNPQAITLFGGVARSTTGTITKTGANSFTFSITMKDISSGASKIATGSGNYN